MFTRKINDNSDKPGKVKKASFKNVVTYFKEYCNSTSIHGFRYFGESRTIWEKIWWLFVFAISLSLCILLIFEVYKKWDQSPVIVTFATKSQYISNIPFPAITVCAEAKIRADVFDYTEALKKKHNNMSISEKEEGYLSHSIYICDEQPEFHYQYFNYSNTKFYNIIESLESMSPLFKISHCKYKGIRQDCDTMFTKIITNEGICYSFNIVDRKEIFRDDVVFTSEYHNTGFNSSQWSIENGYTGSIETYPRRAVMAGAKYGVEFDLSVGDHMVDGLCRNSVEGFRILFHAPIRFPSPKQEYIFVPYKRVLAATITPTQIWTSTAVKNYSAKKRNCFFPAEKQLKYFRIYSQRNCDMECVLNFTLKKCNCAMFYMPRFNGTRICDTGVDLDCADRASLYLQTIRLYTRVTYQNRVEPNFFKKHTCTCRPLCTDLNYKISSSQAIWSPKSTIKLNLNDNKTFANISQNVAKVRAYFVSSDFIGSERNELYGPIDFLANFGGLLGLFTGFSILSLMEIFYFLSVRLLGNRRLFGQWFPNQE